jgi:hypothetical protein
MADGALHKQISATLDILTASDIESIIEWTRVHTAPAAFKNGKKECLAYLYALLSTHLTATLHIQYAPRHRISVLARTRLLHLWAV